MGLHQKMGGLVPSPHWTHCESSGDRTRRHTHLHLEMIHVDSDAAGATLSRLFEGTANKAAYQHSQSQQTPLPSKVKTPHVMFLTICKCSGERFFYFIPLWRLGFHDT